MTTTHRNNIRNATHKQSAHYESRVTRSVVPNQPELAKPLRLLEEHTHDLVDYKPIGRLGVTLVMLEPLLRQIFSTNRRGNISHEALSDFEAELNDAMDYSQHAGYSVALQDKEKPLALYGKQNNQLGIRLNEKDYRLVGDRAMVEAYIRDNYDASKRFIDKNLVKMRPHITIGEVKYEGFGSIAARQDFQDDPSDFLSGRAVKSMGTAAEVYGLSIDQSEIVFPKTIALNGLRIFCQQK